MAEEPHAPTGAPPADRLQRLRDLVTRLRGPDGCPWDREQRLEDLRAYVLEEAHEIAAAIDGGDREELRDEVGDLLFLLAFVIRLGEEEGAFSLSEVVDRLEAKIVSRHPHVFGEERLADSRAVRRAWERRKLRAEEAPRSLLAGVADSLPALVAAYRLTQKAAGVGFDWPDASSVLEKIEEELHELRRALARPAAESSPAVREEVGDLLFTVANLARRLGIDPEGALAGANRKFRHRFRRMEELLRSEGQPLEEASREELERKWRQAKGEESPLTGEPPRA